MSFQFATPWILLLVVLIPALLAVRIILPAIP